MFKLPISHLGGGTELMMSLELRGEVRQGWRYTFWGCPWPEAHRGSPRKGLYVCFPESACPWAWGHMTVCPCVYNDIHDLEGHIQHNFLSDAG